MITKAIMFKKEMAHKHKNIGQQVRTMCNDWSDDNESVLPSPPICKDCNKWISQADCIYMTVLSYKPFEPIESPQGASWKISPSHSLWLGISLLYLCQCRCPSYHSWQKM
jgi:hypothetical protein